MLELPLLVAILAITPDDEKEPPHDPEGITLPDGFKWDEWAREPLVPDPVAFTVLPDGSLFVCESERQDRGVEDNRYSPYWLLDDLACTSIEQRLAIYEKWKDKKEGGMAWFSKYADRVRRLRDTDGNGKADQSTNFSGDLREPLDGTAAGALQVGDALWVTCIPNVWRFIDRDGDGVAEVREKLFTGFGVKTSLRGHDMHGLVQGPDGRIYWSIGDRGYNVKTKEGKVLAASNTGAVFRCEPDGSNLEVFYEGLRNPQEIAFNDAGDLFTVDNNSDAGDKARVCYLPDGGETGWEMPYQTLEAANKRGPWEQEHLWFTFDPADTLQAAWLTPPVAHLTSGPSGFAAYPGTGFPAEFNGTFLITDFLGGDAYSQVWRFGVKPAGAGYEMVNPEIFIKDVLPTDVEFAPDGRLYVSDWWNGWQSDGKGRIYRVWHPESMAKPAAQQVVQVLKQGFRDRTTSELVALLDHDDRRLRQGAHLELAERGSAALTALNAVLDGADSSERARLHALWAMQIIARRQAGKPAGTAACKALIAMCGSSDDEMRAQAARALGDATCPGAAEAVRPLATEESARVRSMACSALGRLKDAEAIPELTAILWENENRDPWLRHAAATALARIGDSAKLQTMAADGFAQVRLGAALAMRRMRDPAIERLLFDPDTGVALEAARAINDLDINAAMPGLAALGDRFTDAASNADVGGFTADNPRTLPLLRRVIAANRRVSDPAAVARLAELARSSRIPPAARLLAMEALAEWAAPGPREPVQGHVIFIDPASRDQAAWKRTLTNRLPALVTNAPDEAVRDKARELAAKAGIALDSAAALRTALDAKADSSERIACLKQLEQEGGAPLDQAVRAALASSDPALRAAARDALARRDPAAALPLLRAALNEGSVPERQAAIRSLASIQSPEADTELATLATSLLDGSLAPALQLDVSEAYLSRASKENPVAAWKAAQSSTDPLAPFMICLEGGDAERGRRVLNGHAGAQCLRCHALAGGGGHAAPSLEGVARRYDRKGLLESLIVPNAKIAPGFGPTSAMPTMSVLLTPREIRDVVAYLSTLQ
ncbi:MAG: glucose dehydrogenase [Planctomycetes bacterium]|nr:glucose dehydrogenase [Planctomycetota bacterium]